MSLELSGTTGVKGVAGSVSAPSIVGDDTNTGISFPSADTIKFSTGGVERMSITNSGVSGITAGITEADQWRLTTTLSNNGDNGITANWERNDTEFEKIGTGLSQSSGVYTFPSTGKYLIMYRGTGTGNGDRYIGINQSPSLETYYKEEHLPHPIVQDIIFAWIIFLTFKQFIIPILLIFIFLIYLIVNKKKLFN